jgi:hypothetical protein
MTTEARKLQAVTIVIQREWDGALLQTDHLQPPGSSAALVEYRLDPSPVDGGMPPRVAAPFADALIHCGLVAGRWFERTPPQSAVQFLPGDCRFIRRAIRRVTGRWAGDLAITHSAATVTELIDRGWNMQFQMLLVLDPESSAPAEHALRALRQFGTWNGFTLTPPVIALVAPGVDGDYAMVAADTERRVSDMLEVLVRAFAGAGFAVHNAA